MPIQVLCKDKLKRGLYLKKYNNSLLKSNIHLMNLTRLTNEHKSTAKLSAKFSRFQALDIEKIIILLTSVNFTMKTVK